MIINQCTITEAELEIAVHQYLKTLGISIPVESVKKSYGSYGGYSVEFKDPVPEPEPAPPATQVISEEIPL